MNWSHIELLSKKPLCDFTPEEYKIYVRTLFFKKQPRKKKEIKIKPPFVVKTTKKDALSIKVNRKPQWMSREEIDSVSVSTGRPLAEVWNYVTKRKIKISTLEEETRIKVEIEAIPF